MTTPDDRPLILVAHTDVTSQTMLRLVLERDGYRVVIAKSKYEALQLAQSLLPDVIITEVLKPPQFQDFEVVRELRQNAATSRIAILIASNDSSGLILGLDLGADDFIYMPFHVGELRSRVKSRIRTRALEKELEVRNQELNFSLKALERRTQELEGILHAVATEKLRLEQKSVFISYRRSESMHLARLIYQDLQAHAYDAFLDVNTIDSGPFDHIILNQIAARAHFVLILSRGSLQRCTSENDWLRREIEEAIRLERNIVPVFDEGFEPSKEKFYLPDELTAELFRNNALPYSHFYSKASLETLRERFLKPAVDVTITPTPIHELVDVQARIDETDKTFLALDDRRSPKQIRH